MKVSGWISATFLASTVFSIETLPFSPPTTETSLRALDILRILKRADNNCPAGHNPCSNLGHAEVCCARDSRCSRDAADNIACCPTGASCTGSLTGSTGGGGDSTSFKFPQTATATSTTGPNEATITGSTLPGAYPFVLVPTTFPNAGVCSSYYSLCESEYTQCLTHLGAGYGVTVAGGGGGVTRAATPAAMSTCSSLSLQACHGLNLGYCGTYATGQGDENVAGPGRPTSLQDLFFGMVIGVAGMFV